MLRKLLLLPLAMLGLCALWTLQNAWMFDEAAWLASLPQQEAQPFAPDATLPVSTRPPVVDARAGSADWSVTHELSGTAEAGEVALVPWPPAPLLGSGPREHAVAVFVIFLGLTACSFYAGRRQRSEAGGTWRRLAAVSVCLGGMWSLPFVVWALLAAALPQRALLDVEVLGLALLVTWIVFASMRPPGYFYQGKEPLPLCDDAEVLRPLRELAARLGIACPRARVQRALGEGENCAAMAGGLAPSSLLVYREMLDQFPADERNFILAHELAHIANGSLWWCLAVWPASLAAAVAVRLYSSWWFAAPFALALLAGARRVVSRRFELDCDRRAARLVGVETAQRALAGLHAAQLLPRGAWLTALAHATSTHPPLETRLANVERAVAGNAASQNVEHGPCGPSPVRQARLLARVVFAVWMLGLSASVWLEVSGVAPLAARLTAVALALAPLAFLRLALRRRISIARRRLHGPVDWRKLLSSRGTQVAFWIVLLALCQLAFLGSDELFSDDSGWLAIGVALGGPLVVLTLLQTSRLSRQSGLDQHTTRLHLDVTSALQRGDYAQAVQLADDWPERVRSDRVLRYNAAMAAAGAGDRQRAVRELEALVAAEADFPLPWLSLACILLDDDQPQRAIDLAQAASPLLAANDPAPYAIAARALRRLGRPNEALAACETLRRLAPDDGSVLALAAQLALDLDNLVEADRWLDEAAVAAPGHLTVRMAQAERALAAGSVADIDRSLAVARAIVRQHPLSFRDRELERLEQRRETYIFAQAGKSLNSTMACAVPTSGISVQVTQTGQ